MAGISSILRKLMGSKKGVIKQVMMFDSRSPVVAEPISEDINGDGKAEIITATSKGELIVLNSDSTKLWSFSIKESVGEVEEMFLDKETSNSINASPRVCDLSNEKNKQVQIIFGTEFGKVYSLDNKGKVLWKFSTEGAIRGSINIVDFNNDGKKEIVFGSTDKFVYVLNSKGKLIMKIEAGSEVESVPVMLDNLLIFGNNQGDIWAHRNDGKPVWRYKTGSKITAEPVIANIPGVGKCIVVGSTDNTIYCIDSMGHLVWSYETEGAIYSKATIEDINGDGIPEVVFSSCDNKVHVLDVEGRRVWDFETDFWIVGSPVVMDIDNDGKKEVIIGSYDTHLYVLSGEGSFDLSYVPGISGIITQEGSYADIQVQSPGAVLGKRLWFLKTSGIIIGCCSTGKQIIAQTKDGLLLWFEHIPESAA